MMTKMTEFMFNRNLGESRKISVAKRHSKVSARTNVKFIKTKSSNITIEFIEK